MIQYTIDSSQPDDIAVSQRVVTAVADARDVDPLELPPLYNVIDPDALDSLFDSQALSGQDGLERVVFMMADCEVVVHGDGEVAVTAPGERGSIDSESAETEQDDARTA